MLKQVIALAAIGKRLGQKVSFTGAFFLCYVWAMQAPWITSPTFTISPWSIAAPVAEPKPAPEYQNDENLKKDYGIELAKSTNHLDAAFKIAGDDTSKAMWMSFHWPHDPIVIASRDIYLKTLEISKPVLDREQLAAKALAIADEKVLKNGVFVPSIEAKDRLAAIRLYSDIVGYTGKVEIDNSNNKTTIKEMVVKLVKAEDKKPAIVIDNAPNVKSENVEHASPITLKLVSGASR